MNNGQEWVERLDGIFKISSPGNRYMTPPPPTKTAHHGFLLSDPRVAAQLVLYIGTIFNCLYITIKGIYR